MNSAKPLITILAVAVIAVMLYTTGDCALTRYDVGGRCDTGVNCKQGLCCVRFTERQGNKCHQRNTTGQRCSETRWPLGSRIDSFLGGCPCANGLTCKMGSDGYGICQS
uniref:Putative secreted protein n=1 Tax=Amblyomma triste TaxID=251400 RepID=A0A023G9B9_AMBTT